MQIFCLFFCVLYVIYCELGGKITQSMQVCLSKTSPPLNKSTFHIITALFARVGILFSPTLCFATHWAELTHPFGAVTVVSYQFSSSQLSANSQNNSTTQQSNSSTPEGHHFSLLVFHSSHFLINFCVCVCPSLTTRTKYSPAGSPAIGIWNVGSFVRNERSILIPLQIWIS